MNWLYKLFISNPYMILIVAILFLLVLCAIGSYICDKIEDKLDKKQ